MNFNIDNIEDIRTINKELHTTLQKISKIIERFAAIRLSIETDESPITVRHWIALYSAVYKLSKIQGIYYDTPDPCLDVRGIFLYLCAQSDQYLNILDNLSRLKLNDTLYITMSDILEGSSELAKLFLYSVLIG